MLFKIDDYVRVKPDLVSNQYYDCLWFDDSMEEYRGGVYRIKSINANGYKLSGIKDYVFNDEMVESVHLTETKETNLEHYVGTVAEAIEMADICESFYEAIEGKECNGECKSCKFYDDNSILAWFKSEYKPQPVIELHTWEIDLLKEYSIVNMRFSDSAILESMKERGYFEGVTDTQMSIDDILKYAKVVR